MTTFSCAICCSELQQTDITARCAFCNQEAPVKYICPNGHTICEECQLADWPQVVERVCEGSKETDPSLIANLIMKHPLAVMHSPQHHTIVTPVFLSALRNVGLHSLSPGRLTSAIERTQGIPLGACGSRGECGAATSVGALVSILTGASFTKDKERSLSLQATAETLMAIAQAGGPRCCKQSVYLSIETASTFLKRELDIDLPVKPHCDFSEQNKECKKERCKYYVD